MAIVRSMMFALSQDQIAMYVWRWRGQVILIMMQRWMPGPGWPGIPSICIIQIVDAVDATLVMMPLFGCIIQRSIEQWSTLV
jgi:hypothetical protein